MRMVLLNQTIRSISSYSGTRCFSWSSRNKFISNFFGKKQLKQREDIIKNQDNYETDKDSKIVILNEENSPDYKPFDATVEMPDFKINTWKHRIVRNRDIEGTYSEESLLEIIKTSYKEAKGEDLKNDFSSTSLSDLNFRFKFCKILQQNLGFDINDYILTSSHNLKTLHQALSNIISSRWTSERNPDAIVLRPEDFTAGNVYLNKELTKSQQKKYYQDLLSKAREA